MAGQAAKTRQARKDFREHHIFIAELRAKTPRIYINSHYFQSLNKALFGSLLILQCVQSTGFSSMFEIPQFFMIMLLASFFMYRSQMKLTYGRFAHFLVSYIRVAVLLKILYQVLIKCSWVVHAVAKNDEEAEVTVIKAFFGHSYVKFGSAREGAKTVLYEFSLLGCFFFAHVWKATKAAQCKMLTQHFEESATDQERFEATTKKENLITFKMRLSGFVREYNKGKEEPNRLTEKGLERDILSSYKDGFSSSFGPVLVIWLLRFTLGFQAYLYHNLIGLLHLTWILLSFIFSAKATLLLSAVFMVPFYTFEFIMVYGGQLRVIKDVHFFKKYGEYFVLDLKRPILEQNLYFLNLLLFYMTIGSLKYTFDNSSSGTLGSFFTERIRDPASSVIWRFLFLILRYIQSLVLIILFLNGSDKLNNFRNLGFMVFFVVYAGSEQLYRNTSQLLTIFIAFFIWSQYYFALTYHDYVGDRRLMARLEWYNVYQEKHMPTWQPGDSVYFRHTPYLVDLVFLVLMASLNSINRMYVDDDAKHQLSRKSYNFIREQYAGHVYLAIRLKNQLESYMIGVILVVMFYFIGKQQCTLINWAFWCLNLLALK